MPKGQGFRRLRLTEELLWSDAPYRTKNASLKRYLEMDYAAKILPQMQVLCKYGGFQICSSI